MRGPLNRLQSRDSGFTLIEVVVAVLILSLGTIAAFRALDNSGREIGEAPQRLLAQQVLLNQASELRLFGPSAAQSRTMVMGPFTFTVETELLPTEGGLIEARLTAQSEGGVGAAFVIYLPGVAQ